MITIDDKVILFKCDRYACGALCPSLCPSYPYYCRHTTKIEHAVFDGEKVFDPLGDVAMLERIEEINDA